MKSGYRLFLFLFAFYAIVGAIYWWLGGEPLGVTALIIGYYFWFINRRTGGVLPEDNPDALISDGAGELGFYSPYSWWPLPVGLAATAVGLSLVIGWWLTLIAVGALIISVMGFVLEYERPSNSPYSSDSHH
jgi:hypothetical protein